AVAGDEAAPRRRPSLIRRLASRGRAGSKDGSLLDDGSKSRHGAAGGGGSMDGSKTGSIGGGGGGVDISGLVTGYVSRATSGSGDFGGGLDVSGLGAVTTVDAVIDKGDSLAALASNGSGGGGAGSGGLSASGKGGGGGAFRVSRWGTSGRSSRRWSKSQRTVNTGSKAMMLSDMSASRRKLNMSAVGTRAFASPEMLLVDRSTGRYKAMAEYGLNVDEYALGSMLRYMLTGCPPDRTVADFKAGRSGFCSLCMGMVPPPIKYLTEVSSEARDLCLALCDRNPDTRLGLSMALLHPWVLRGNFGPLDAWVDGPRDGLEAAGAPPSVLAPAAAAVYREEAVAGGVVVFGGAFDGEGGTEDAKEPGDGGGGGGGGGGKMDGESVSMLPSAGLRLPQLAEVSSIASSLREGSIIGVTTAAAAAAAAAVAATPAVVAIAPGAVTPQAAGKAGGT
ncbi:unnamed protein product, partial [Phaeothamnion confervicola]